MGISVDFQLIKRQIKIKPSHECRCDERPETKSEDSRRLGYTGFLGELEHLKIKTRLIDEMFVSVRGECVLEVIDVPSILKLIRKSASLTRVLSTFDFRFGENAARRK